MYVPTLRIARVWMSGGCAPERPRRQPLLASLLEDTEDPLREEIRCSIHMPAMVGAALHAMPDGSLYTRSPTPCVRSVVLQAF